jgi:tryptophan synthase alpha subunit
MTTRIERRFADLKAEGRAGLVIFVTAATPITRPRWTW